MPSFLRHGTGFGTWIGVTMLRAHDITLDRAMMKVNGPKAAAWKSSVGCHSIFEAIWKMPGTSTGMR